MKSFLIIGMGSLGHHLCNEFQKNDSEVMIADISPEAVEDMLPYVVSAKVGDCTKLEVLKSFGVDEFDACFVCVGDSFQNCLEITDLLRELGAKKIYSAADRDIEEKFLLRNGADRIIYPERDIANRIASSESSNSIFDCINLSQEYSIFEIEVPEKWLSRTISELDVRKRYNLNIIAYKRGEQVNPIFRNDYIFNADEHILLLGHINDVRKLLK